MNNVKKIFLLILFTTLGVFVKAGNPLPKDSISVVNTSGDDNKITDDCKYKGIKLYGKIKFVTAFPDIKIQIVEAFPDIKIKMVQAFPDQCGQWQVVEAFPDIKVQIVDAFPDIKVKFVEAFPGIK